ncbi:MAG: hypothetical protein H0Z38_05075, partial [Firmicutes bacterium]|nr:hypothetical protein [Bacillota bacterium]
MLPLRAAASEINTYGVPVITTGPLSFGLRGQKTLGYRWIELNGSLLKHHWVPVA